MNVYDFDGTIYNGDSSIDFYIFCLKKNLKIVRYIPKQIKAIALYKFNKINKTEMKQNFFVFVQGIDVNNYLKLFWKKNRHKIKKWYLDIKKGDDLIISASPEFLLRPICEKLEIKNLIASNVDINTGIFKSKNCKGKTKVDFYKKIYGDTKINCFYSDSLSDEPLAKISESAYLVNGNRIKEWKF